MRQFATSNQIQILIINIDAFRKVAVDADDKKGNVIHRDNDISFEVVTNAREI